MLLRLQFRQMSQVFNMSARKCRHSVHSTKTTNFLKEQYTNWWDRLFDAIEEDVNHPDLNQHVQVLKQIFPDQLLHKILHILNIVPTSGISFTSTNDWIFVPPQEKMEQQEDLPSLTTTESDGIRKRYDIGEINPYAEFFKRNPDRAAIWHPLPPISLDEMHLTQKADAITERIAQDFVDWMKRLFQQDGVTQTTLTVDEVIKMFEIGFNTQAAKTLSVRFKEIATVPDQVAYLKQLPKLAKRNVLYRQIHRDVIASRRQRKLLAFGRILPVDLQIQPPSCEEIKNKWFGCDRIHEELQSMATVFHDVTHLATTRGFCKYLLEHPEITPPRYLQDCGMLDLKNLVKMEPTMDEDDDDVDDFEFELPETKSIENVIEEDNENVVDEDDGVLDEENGDDNDDDDDDDN